MNTIRTLVALDEGVNHEAVQASLPVDSDIQIVGIVDGLEDSWATLQETPTDLLVVACAGYSDRALYLIDGAVKQQRLLATSPRTPTDEDLAAIITASLEHW